MRASSILSFLLPSALLQTASAIPAILDGEIEDATTHNATLMRRRECGSGARGECVIYYSGSDCTGTLGSYAPDCTGNCFQYSSFNSLKTNGGGFLAVKGTACKVYSDNNCQNQIADLGNSVDWRCGGFSGGNSMRCYWGC